MRGKQDMAEIGESSHFYSQNIAAFVVVHYFFQ